MAHIEKLMRILENTDKEVEIVAKAYEKELPEEINEQRAENGKKPFESLDKKE